MNNLKVGDKVQLTSGSATMTVESVEGQTIYCVWFWENSIKRDNFPSAALVKRD